MRRPTVLLVAAASAASLAAPAHGGQPQGGILEPAGAGVRIVYTLGNSSVQCSFGRSGHVPQLACGTDGLKATIDARRVAFFRFRAGRSAQLRAVSQRAGDAVYGPFRPDPSPRVITLAEGASIGFFVSPRRLRELLVVGDGINSPPYRVVTEWRP